MISNQKLIIKKPNIKVVIIGFFSFINLKLFGSLICPLEISGLIFLILEISNNKFKKNFLFENHIFKSISALLILWASCQFISDIINKSEFKDSVKGILAPVLVLVSLRLLIYINEIFNYKDFIQDLLIGFSIYKIYNLFLTSESIDFFLKMGGTLFSTIFIVSLIRNNFIKLVITIMIGIFSFIYGARSSSFIILCFLISEFLDNRKNKFKYSNQIFKNVIYGFLKYITILLIFLSISPLISFSNNLISKVSPNIEKSEVFKKDSQSKFGVFGSRTEYFSFFDAFKESPLIGHGSWAKDWEYKYTLMGARQKTDYQGKTDNYIIKKLFKGSVYKWDVPPIPKHSFVMQTTLWAGLIATSFFFYLLNANLLIILNRKLNYSLKLLLILNVWNILFSPIGDHRLYIPIICLITILFFGKPQKKET